MDENELNELINKKLRTIDSEEYMIKTCSFDDEECNYDDCNTCSRARTAIRDEILEEEEVQIIKNAPTHILAFRPDPLIKNGASCKVNLANTIAEASDSEIIIKVTGLPSKGWKSINDGPELDKPFPLWPKIREHVSKETPIQELLFQDNKLPLLVQCEGRVLAIAPEIK